MLANEKQKMYNQYNTFLEYTDEQLLSLLKRSNENAFTVIYNRYNRLLYVLAYKYLKDKDVAKDIVQQIFLKLWEIRETLIINVNLKNYLHTMLKNYTLNEIRNNLTALEKNYEMAQSPIEYENEILSRLEEKEQMIALYHAINGLPEQKKIVCLYKLQGNLSNQEIAKKMQISIPTVKTHYAQAIKILRNNFDKTLLLITYLLIR
ncbi:RNA polymerase sigma-70 factor [uncultured Parabacteroides sp.]|uniref:RNA polymerase sigma-70 factor n=1 Tax=uncultured Parabacteroides sp. TaxID=512312 RepID=UPI00258DEACD|nr:RNA polymerase sigma-70 factor [uncultured Parabacteroides sp.]